MSDQKNTILAIVLSALVLIVWQLYFGVPQMEKQKQIQQQQQAQERSQQPPTLPQQTPGTVAQTPPAPGTAPQAPAQGGTVAPQTMSRDAALAASPRVRIETPSLSGSISLKGGRIDDLSLVKYRETVDPNSPPIVLLAPSGSPHPFYAQFGWIAAPGTTIKRPDDTTLWTQQGSGPLTLEQPLQLVYDNGEGLEFRRTISVDDKYMFTIRDEVANKGSTAVSLYPFGLISRHGTPKLEGYLVSHEGFVGVLADRVQEEKYSEVEKKIFDFQNTQGWLGFTDKYWAATLIPDPTAKISARFRYSLAGSLKTYHAEFNLESVTIPPGGTAGATTRLFAGAKEVALIDGYGNALKLDRFDHLIDWGYFYFITKPLFIVMDWIYHLVGNFGIAILLITVVVKLIFFPLANKSYASMAKMKAVQPEMMAIRERYADDKMKQQQAMMELYKKEQINPIAGCLPILIQVPVFFALYKVLFITIEMRHAPLFGWIRDLSAPDPTTIFNLFGLIPWDPSHLPLVGPFLMLGVWPLIMGVTMWVQMKLNPPPPDPTQQMIFDWMPVIFTFMLSSFSAGLVIYWAWNNALSVIQQSVIMRRNGAKIELFDNIKGVFTKKKLPAE